MAEGIFKELTKSSSEIAVCSAGLMANIGENVSEYAVMNITLIFQHTQQNS